MSGHRYAGSLSASLVLMMGISRSYLWKIETGTADVGIDVLIGIARALDIPVRELVDSKPIHQSGPSNLRRKNL